MKFATNYFDYMSQCYELGNQTCLAKILGIYQVAIRATKNGKETRHDLLVMENLSFGQHIARQYDLKGALHARFNSASNNSDDVLLDQNFVNDMNVSPLYVSRKSKRNLQRAIYNDTNFLNSINVMDYSLLVGVDTQRRELACGIIDYLRQYTWDKQLENWVKSSLVVPKNQLPTIISPKEYKKRFRKFINTHFLSVPDHWCSQRSSNPCKLCGPALESGSLHKKSQKRGNQDDDSSHGTSQKQGKHDDGSLKSPHHSRQNGFSA
ncbi:UNVERIFIED_CONTAM: putative 1-phosphatidylinositol-3-phosphate 5-kinase FAB1D [Sesamum latifolium]|uniref:1-phosphatidylinositol-3-phosphate 5-kinase FAB1D n=1 Tax=Sesamum latifolium TaxID=2727402 RepID=A0AAW2VSF7_9LAMI